MAKEEMAAREFAEAYTKASPEQKAYLRGYAAGAMERAIIRETETPEAPETET